VKTRSCINDKRAKVELLAPAKDKETAFEAINCGADAVYIGASSFGARKNACNTLKDIEEVVLYAHKYRAKVYVTVNTILTDNELQEAVALIKELDRICVDAILIQDFGLLEKLMELNLSIPIHASTQCDNRDIEKIRFLKDIGLSRVVLARELSLEQIKAIHDSVPDIEIEAFVHGALCVSYSGQCYLSQYIGGRSANRGECAQPCRKKYKVVDEAGKIYDYPYPLCLKDFNASNSLEDMIKAGVYSFKIEGRLKDIGYVKNIVSYYRQQLDKYSVKASSGKSFINFIPDPERTFNRGYTDYFLHGRTDCFNPLSPKSKGKFIGCVKYVKKGVICLSTDYKISSQDGLCFINDANEQEGFLVNKIENNGETLIYPNRSVQIKKGAKIYRNLDVEFEKELLKVVKRKIAINVELKNNLLNVTDEDGINISVEINADEKPKNLENMKDVFVKQLSKTGESDFYINEIKIDGDIPFLPVSQINNLRRIVLSELMSKRLSAYKRDIQKPLHYSQYYKNELDYRANVHNKSAKMFYEKCGAKVKEFSMETSLPKNQIELMRTKHCIKFALNLCKSPINLHLQDEKGQNYPLRFDCKNCEMVVLSK